jgi:Flp pilus assembly protein TadG
MTGAAKDTLRVMARRLRARWRGRSEAGEVVVEFAFTFPIFALFLYGIVEFSHYVFTDIALADAAREGARYAMVRGASSPTPASTADITTFVKGQIALLDPASATVTVTYNPDNNPGSTVNVKVSYPFTPFMPGFGYIAAQTMSGNSQITIAQ